MVPRWSSADLARWRDEGWLVLPGFLRHEELAPARAALTDLWPTATGFHGGTDERAERLRGAPFAGLVEFPFPLVALSLLAVHPAIAAFAEAALGTSDLRLYHAEAWAKYTGAADYDQDLHRDYVNHTMTVPTADHRFTQLLLYLYLDDVPEGCGPTHFVDRRRTADVPLYPAAAGRRAYPELYDGEVSAAAPAGSLVAYQADIFHRATAMTEPGGARFTLLASYRPAGAEWGHRYGWADRGYWPGWQPFVEQASVRQLELVGFPPPGHPYWTPATLAGVALRYPGLDITPWRVALG